MGSKMMQVKEPGVKTSPDSVNISTQCGLRGLFHRSRFYGIRVGTGVTIA
jgi:hypothetical protein